jgi:hypothetical protein
MPKVDDKPIDSLQREIAETELQTKQLQLAEARERNAKFLQHEEIRHRSNQQRQAEFKQAAASNRALQKDCRHKAGGSPSNIHRGGGKFAFSLLTRAIMPDGKTELIQCQRCRLRLYGRERTPVEIEKLKELDAADAKKGIVATRYEDHVWWLKLRETSIEEGIPNNEMRGPTFNFQNADGVNFIPDMV